MKWFPRLRFSLWTLLWLAVLIGAGMGMYAKREPWRMAWGAKDLFRVEEFNGLYLSSDKAFLYGYEIFIDSNQRILSIVTLDLTYGQLNRKKLVLEDGEEVLFVNSNGTRFSSLPISWSDERNFVLISEDSRRFPIAKGHLTPHCHMSSDGKYVTWSDLESLYLYRVGDGVRAFTWKVDQSPYKPAVKNEIYFSEDSTRIFLRLSYDEIEEWDLNALLKIRSWPKPVVPEIKKLSNFTIQRLKDGRYVKTWQEGERSRVVCCNTDGVESWRLSGEKIFSGDGLLYENGLVLQSQGVPGTWQELVYVDTGERVFANEQRIRDHAVEFFPDGFRMLALKSSVMTSRPTVIDFRTKSTLFTFPNTDSQGTILPQLIIVGNDRMCYGRESLNCFVRIRPEYWWGWLYIPETYIAVVALTAMLFGLIKRLRTKAT